MCFFDEINILCPNEYHNTTTSATITQSNIIESLDKATLTVQNKY